VSGGLRRQTGILVGRGENLTRRMGTLILMSTEELPLLRCFCAVGDIFGQVSAIYQWGGNGMWLGPLA
jgi:hypothetical protein